MIAPAATRPRLVLAICLATGFTTLLDQSILNVAVPALRADLGADREAIQWILAVYSLTFGLALVPAGRLGDSYGRGRLLVAGLALFSGASLVGVFATAPWVLVLARLLQGIGAGVANPQVIGLLQDHFSGPARARALGSYAVVASVASVVAPIVGGLTLELAGPAAGWRVVVALNIPFGIATCALAARHLPRRAGRPGGNRAGHRAQVDTVGIALITALTLCILLPVVGVGGTGPGLLGWVLSGLAVVAGLIWWERSVARRGGVPILLPALVRSGGFVLGTVVAMCWFGCSLGSSLVITLFLQEGLGLGPLAAGLCTLPSAIAMGIASALAWRVVGRWGRPSVTYALVALVLVVLATIAAVTYLPAAALPLVLAGSQLLTGAAGGFVTAPNQGLSLGFAPPGANGLAAGFFQVAQRISATVCLAAFTGAVVAAATPGSLAGYRSGLVTALWIAAALTVLASVASALDRTHRRTETGRRAPPVIGG